MIRGRARRAVAEDSEGRRVVKREARRVVEVKRIVVHARRFGGVAWYSTSNPGPL